ncbi:MAG TPA: hypothetical protein VLT82_01520 [Myxococcaceae bacterium]|nr:hypothetical protein [Myxococcaceae bacterium]
MLKFLLLSIVLLTFIIPAYAARGKDPRRALLSALGAMALVELGYAFFLLLVYPRLV